MSRIRTNVQRASVERVPVPHPYRWAAAAVTGVIVAAWVYLQQLQVPSWIPDGGQGALDLIRQVTCALILLSAFIAMRRSRLAWLAYRPGPLAIEPFADLTGGGAPAEETMWDFRRALGDMRLSPPGSVPGSSTQQGWLDVVRTAGDSKGPLAVIAGLASAVISDHVYRVRGVLLTRAAQPSLGLTVQVSILPTDVGTVETVWDSTWTDVAKRGANIVAAFVLPRTRMCRKPPWTAWAGMRMPADLIDHHRAAKALSRGNRHEEALSRYLEALRLDPLNPYLRIEMLQVEEQLRLHLDAVAGYIDLIAVESWQDRRLWKWLAKLRCEDQRESPKVRLRAPSHGRSALLLARYRLVCQLANGKQLADQWRDRTRKTTELSPHDGPNRREAERESLRLRLSPWLNGHYRSFFSDYGRSVDDRKFPIALDPKSDESLLRLFFQFVAVAESRRLLADYRWIRFRRRPGMIVSQQSLRMMQIWAPLQLYAAQLDTSLTAGPLTSESLRSQRFARTILDNNEWPPDLHLIHRQVSRVLGTRWRRTDWQAEYNAACTLAVSIFPAGGRKPSPEKTSLFATEAVRHLERAISAAHSGYVAGRSAWLASGDQDLNKLRTTPEFVGFANRYFPAGAPSECTPINLLTLLLSHHVVAVACRYAHMRRICWEQVDRISRGNDQARAELEQEEVLAARILGDYARNIRHWPSRLELIDETKRFARVHDCTYQPAALPDYRDDPVARSTRGGSQVDVDKCSNAAIEARDDVWVELVHILDTSRSGSKRWHRIERILEQALELDSADSSDTAKGIFAWLRSCRDAYGQNLHKRRSI